MILLKDKLKMIFLFEIRKYKILKLKKIERSEILLLEEEIRIFILRGKIWIK